MKSRFERSLRDPLHAPAVILPVDPLVSVIMTTFNSSPWLAGSVSSVLAQSWRNFELVVVDDGSVDETPELLRRWAEADMRVRACLLDRNIGTYPAKNIGMSISHGDVVAFMDSDDFIDANRLQKQLDRLRQPGLVATTCNYVRKTIDGVIVPNGGLMERQALVSLMFKRQVLLEVGWFDRVRTSADDEFFERIRHIYGRGAHSNVSEPLYHALYRNDSLTTQGAAPMLMGATNDEGMLSPPRRAYVEAYRSWYLAASRHRKRPYIPFEMGDERPFPIPLPLELSGNRAS